MSRYEWECGCGLRSWGEAAAQRHVKDDGCRLMGYPKGYAAKQTTQRAVAEEPDAHPGPHPPHRDQ